MTKILKISFWLSVGTIIYTFLGYPLLISLVARWRGKPVAKRPITPTVTVVIPAYNEEAVIGSKIENSLALDYPRDRLQIMVVADGSDDQTTLIADRYPEISVKYLPERRGKAAAINRVVPEIESEILVFTDANTIIQPGALRALVANFADPSVGGVAGEKRVSGGGEGLYWRYESYLKTQDSAVSSVMGAAGELFAVRRAAFQATEEDAIIEDFMLSLRMVAAGWRVVYEPGAVAEEPASPGLLDDWRRRTRIAAGGIQSICRLPELVDPRRGWVSWQYLSHRVLRWAVTPFLLPIAYSLNLAMRRQKVYGLLLAGQTLFYGLGIVGGGRAVRGRRGGLSGAVFYFCLANLAAIVGAGRYATGRQPVTWQKARRR